MTDLSSPSPTPLAARLSLAHRVLAILAVLGAVYSVIPWPVLPAGENLKFLAGPALGVLLCGLIYLAVSATVHMRFALLLGRGGLIGKWGAGLALLGHAVVAVCAVGVMVTGASSNVLLVSLQRLDATLISLAVLSLLISAADWFAVKWQVLRNIKKGERQSDDETEPARQIHDALGWSLLLIVTTLALSMGIILLERKKDDRPKPKDANAINNRDRL